MSVCLCLMVWNEEEKLAASLQSAADLANQTIVVDTASTDRRSSGSSGSSGDTILICLDE